RLRQVDFGQRRERNRRVVVGQDGVVNTAVGLLRVEQVLRALQDRGITLVKVVVKKDAVEGKRRDGRKLGAVRPFGGDEPSARGRILLRKQVLDRLVGHPASLRSMRLVDGEGGDPGKRRGGERSGHEASVSSL